MYSDYNYCTITQFPSPINVNPQAYDLFLSKE